MKTQSSLIFAISFAVICATLSLANNSFNSRRVPPRGPAIDTVKWYSVSLQSWNNNGRVTYKVNGVEVKKKTYDKYTITTAEIYACHPCYVKTVSIDQKLLYEGDQVTDCPVGFWKEYYDNGNVKVEGNYKPDSTGVYDLNKSAEWCAIRHGKWTYYNKEGSIDSVVNYVNNIRTK